jgi:hypothetical protein
MDLGVNDRDDMKSLCEANDNDARVCRHLLGGIFMALFVLPRLEHQGIP